MLLEAESYAWEQDKNIFFLITLQNFRGQSFLTTNCASRLWTHTASLITGKELWQEIDFSLLFWNLKLLWILQFRVCPQVLLKISSLNCWKNPFQDDQRPKEHLFKPLQGHREAGPGLLDDDGLARQCLKAHMVPISLSHHSLFLFVFKKARSIENENYLVCKTV